MHDLDKVKKGDFTNLYQTELADVPNHTSTMNPRHVPEEAKQMKSRLEAEQKRLDDLKIAHADFVA
jgi:hypothetical protein